jgi:diaminopimelate epimerase
VSYPFLKGHGTENDFVLLPDHDGSVHGDLSAERVRALCDRRAGIGGDGVLRVIRTSALDSETEWPTQPSVEDGDAPRPMVEEGSQVAYRNQADYQPPEWFMDYRNSDGSHSEMCGNGIRLFARYLMEEGLVPDGEPVRIGTQAGVKTVTRDGEVFTVDMGTARFLGETKVGVGGRSWSALHVDLGNPHAVVMVEALDEAGSLAHAPAYDESLFPEGVNVEFVCRRGPNHVAMRVHERGSGETRSCGTGACAAALAAAGEGPGTWRVDVPGGTLTVARDAAGHVFLTGPAVIVAEGTTGL